MHHLSRLCTPCWFSPYPDGIAGELSAKNLKSGGTLENWKEYDDSYEDHYGKPSMTKVG